MKLNKLTSALLALGTLGLAGCNGGSSTSSNATGSPLTAQSTHKLFASNSCLVGKISAQSGSQWYASGSIDITNTCDSEQSLSGETISLTSQDKNGSLVNLGTFNNWWVNGGAYVLSFTAGNGNQQVGEVTSGVSPVINAHQTISFNGGMNLNGSDYDVTTAQNSLSIGGGVNPSPTPTPTPPVVSKGELDVSVDTSGAGCSGVSCGTVTVKVTDSNGSSIADFTVPSSSLGAVYTQPIKEVESGSYTVSGSTIASTTVSYTPSATPKVESSKISAVTIKYTKVTPSVKTGKATISLSSVVPNYTGDLQVQVLNAKESNAVVNTYMIKQGGSVTTEDLPISDATHAYKVKLTTGIADPLQGLYYIESGLPALKVTSGGVSSLSIPMKASPVVARRNVTVSISGLVSGDKANTSFSDAANKYSYVSSTNLGNGKVVYKIENNLNLGMSVKAEGLNYETNPIESTMLVKANSLFNAAFSVKVAPTPTPTVTPTPVDANKVVTVYLLIDTPAQLKKYTDDLQRVSKVNFNRVIFSFVKPTITNYTYGSLANTGIMGYFGNGDGQGAAAFKQLKEAITLSKAKNIQPFLSVGGWNYSCNFAEYGTKCGDAPTEANGIHYDWFPDPTDASQKSTAVVSYGNVIKLATDLGIEGIDLDAEEFWHADKYAKSWQGSPWATSIANSINSNGGPSYENLMKYGAGSSTTSGPAVMPKTVDKMAAIMHALEDDPKAKDLMFSTAAPPVGARPITGFVYGDNGSDVYTLGGVWWLGNLKGLWYNLTDKDKSIVDRFDSIGLMTYDLCGDNATTCAPYSGGPIDLAGQVAAYVKDYNTWLKSSAPASAKLTVDNVGKVQFLPAKYNIKSKIQFGFEVNQPAYPRNVSGQLQLTNSLVDKISAQEKDTGGVIIWQMYSVPNTAANGTTSKYTMQQSCKTFLANDSRYDCNADFPSNL